MLDAFDDGSVATVLAVVSAPVAVLIPVFVSEFSVALELWSVVDVALELWDVVDDEDALLHVLVPEGLVMLNKCDCTDKDSSLPCELTSPFSSHMKNILELHKSRV